LQRSFPPAILPARIEDIVTDLSETPPHPEVAQPIAAPPWEEPFRFPWWMRVLLFFPGVVMIGLLVTAFMLKPSQDGYGTHQGLGLPQCTMVQYFGMRCPSCGMTTSWAYATRGNLLASFNANIGGALLALSSMVFGPWMVISAILGRWFVRPPNELYFALGGMAIIAITLIDWVSRHMYI